MPTRKFSLVALLAALLGLVGCEPKKPVSRPSKQATAPTLPTPSPSPAPTAAPTATPDAIAQLISQVEAEYQAGRDNYAAGHLDAAKKNFDNAVNLMLSSSTPIKDDERLSAEFNKVTEGVNDLEMQALRQGDGFTEQRMEPAPIDVANAVTFPVDPNLKAQAEADLKRTQSDLPLVINDYVASYINYYSKGGRSVLVNALRREGRYHEMIERIFREEGVPQDLIYIAIVESGFQPLALSRAGARGMWQFMAERGSGYGLRRNWWVDDRQDPEKATRAAARHLKDLYAQFGDWYLAMAAYNSGPGTIQAGVERTGYADFWELYRRDVLPKETKNYVPIILAAAIMAKNPRQYSLDDVQPDLPQEPDKVTVNYPVDLRLAAECVDVPIETLIDLNPSLLRLTTPREGTFDLNLPAGAREMFLKNIAAIPLDKRVSWRYHKVAAGDTLESVAQRYHTSVKAISQVNNLTGVLQADSRIIIPVTSAEAASQGGYSKHPSRYKVRKGDTVLSVADSMEVPPEQLRRWNHLRGNYLRPGRLLIVYRPQPLGELAPGGSGRRRKTAGSSSRTSTSKGTAQASAKGHRHSTTTGTKGTGVKSGGKSAPKGTPAAKSTGAAH